MNYTNSEIKKIYKKIKEDFDTNSPSSKLENLSFNDIITFYKNNDKNRKRATKEKIAQIPYFSELIHIFGKDIAYKAISKTSLDETLNSTSLFKKPIIIERCIKQKILFLKHLTLKVILMGANIEDFIVYIYIDESNYLVTKVKDLINANWDNIEKETQLYYENMGLENKIIKILGNPITNLISLQLKQIVNLN